MLPFRPQKLPAISAEAQRDTGGQYRQGQPMRLRPISFAAQNAETPGEAPTRTLKTYF